MTTDAPNQDSALTKYVVVFQETVVAVRGTRNGALNAGLNEAGIARSQIEHTSQEYESVKYYHWTETAGHEVADCGFRVGKLEDFRKLEDFEKNSFELRVYDGLEFDEETEAVELRNTTVELDEMLEVAAMFEEIVRADDDSEDVQSWRVHHQLRAFNLLDANCETCGGEGEAVQVKTSLSSGSSDCICMDCLEAAAEELRELAYDNTAEVLGEAL